MLCMRLTGYLLFSAPEKILLKLNVHTQNILLPGNKIVLVHYNTKGVLLFKNLKNIFFPAACVSTRRFLKLALCCIFLNILEKKMWNFRLLALSCNHMVW